MYYEYEYSVVETKDEFISLLYSNYDIPWTTADRRWYDLNKHNNKKFIILTNENFNEIIEKYNIKIISTEISEEVKEIVKNQKEFIPEIKEEIIFPEEKKEEEYFSKYSKEEITKPTQMKLLQIDDMKRMGYKLTRYFLTKYGFTNDEINWLIEKSYLEETQ